MKFPKIVISTAVLALSAQLLIPTQAWAGENESCSVAEKRVYQSLLPHERKLQALAAYIGITVVGTAAGTFSGLIVGGALGLVASGMFGITEAALDYSDASSGKPNLETKRYAGAKLAASIGFPLMYGSGVGAIGGALGGSLSMIPASFAAVMIGSTSGFAPGARILAAAAGKFSGCKRDGDSVAQISSTQVKAVPTEPVKLAQLDAANSSAGSARLAK